MTTAETRVQAAANALAKAWTPTPEDAHALAKVLRHDAWILERAGLLANPKDTQ